MGAMFPVIGFVGYAGSGKSEAAKRLIEKHGYVRERMAGPLKEMLRGLGLTDRELDGDLKEKPCELLCGKTPREAMQLLGTEFGRQMIGGDIWVSSWLRRAGVALSDGAAGVVADDVRFPNEVGAIRSASGLIIRVDRDGVDRRYRHASEDIEKLDVDVIVHNDGTVEDLHGKIDDILFFTS